MPYVEGIKTVLCNSTNGILNTPIPNPLGGRGGVSLDKGDYVDIEKVMSKSAIRKFLPEFERMEGLGYVKWESKDTKPFGVHIPTAKFKPSPIGATIMPPTAFDEKLNELIKAEEERDKRTLPGSLHRQTQAEYDARGEQDAGVSKAYEAEKTKLDDKERELAEKEEWLAKKEAQLKIDAEKMNIPVPTPEVPVEATVVSNENATPRRKGRRQSVARAKAEQEAAKENTEGSPIKEPVKGDY